MFLRDRRLGRTSSAIGPVSGAIYQSEPVLSAGGRFIVITALEQLTPDDRDEAADVFVVNRRTVDAQRVRIGRRDREVQRVVVQPAISRDAGRVAVPVFTGNSRDGTTTNVAVSDRATGESRIVSTTATGRKLANPVPPDVPRPVGLSGDGRHVASLSAASNLVRGDTNGASDVFIARRRPAR